MNASNGTHIDKKLKIIKSASACDVADVANAKGNGCKVPDGKEAVPYAQAAELLLNITGSGQVHENDIAKVVVVCDPGLPKSMGALHPAAALYERPVNLDKSMAEHAAFREVLRKKGLKVLTVREILKYGVKDNLRCRLDLEDLAMNMLKYEFDKNHEFTNDDHAYYISDDYKRHVLESMSVDQLIDVVMTNPTVFVRPSFRDTGLSAAYDFEPLANLIFTRDQQITTAKGVVMASLRSQQRMKEVKIMKFCFQKLGVPVIGEMQPPGYLEGGDFFPAGEDLCFIGVGLRSNSNAVKQLMDNDYLGTRRVAMVKDMYEKHQDRMHLDCVFSILSDDCALVLEEMIGSDSPTRRLVDEFTLVNGKYELSRSDIEFSMYLKDNGYKLITVSSDDQLKYACNVVNLGNSSIISCHAPTARKICRSPHFKGTLEYVPYSAITAMYGALHCSTQIVKRIKQ